MKAGLIIRTGWILAFVLSGVLVRAELRLPALFSDHMVMQAMKEVPCWGWADPGATVTVTFTDAKTAALFSAKAVADAKGSWRAFLPALREGMAGTLKIQAGANHSRVVEDVVVGEVWLASGQSNMTYRLGGPEFPAHVAELARREVAGVGDRVRLFVVIQEGADAPRGDVRGKWIVASNENMDTLPAVPWNFALALQRELGGTAGVIVSGRGGTPIESWLPREALDATTVAKTVWKLHDDLVAHYPEAKTVYDAALAEWRRVNPTPELETRNLASKPTAPYAVDSSKAPVRLFNAMIDGLMPYAIQGVLWYQGEENSGRAKEYAPLVRALITSWRARWGVEWPFYYVELANTRAVQTKPSEGGWALIREAQEAALTLPGTSVVTAVDLGDGKIHPWNKKAVGERLAALALTDVYGRAGSEVRSPEYAAHEIGGSAVTIRVRHARELRLRGDGVARGFAIRGSDGVWHWADVRVEGDQIVARSDRVSAPVAVRYGWASNPLLSVENEAGLPLRPFRTDPEAQ